MHFALAHEADVRLVDFVRHCEAHLHFGEANHLLLQRPVVVVVREELVAQNLRRLYQLVLVGAQQLVLRFEVRDLSFLSLNIGLDRQKQPDNCELEIAQDIGKLGLDLSNHRPVHIVEPL